MPNTASGLRLSITALFLVAAVGCGTGSQQLQTPYYTLTHPDFWKVKKTAAKDGEPTLVVIPQYGAAVIDEGTGSMAAKGQNYDAYTADVEVRLYAWPDADDGAGPTDQVTKRLVTETDLALPKHRVIADNPPECGVYPKKYIVFGNQETPIDLISRPGWRTIVVGGKSGSVLLGVVARVDYEPDGARACHNLANMRVQLQNLLDGLQPAGAKPAAAGAVSAGPTGDQKAKP
jgi:hypothetical protein